MLAFIFSFALMFAETHGANEAKSGGFLDFYNHYLNYPGFEAWKFLNLGIFVAIMIYLLKKPLTEAFKAKREAIRADLINAENEKQAALGQLTSVEAKLVGLDSEKSRIMTNAEHEAEAEKTRIAQQTENEVGKMREQTENEIERLAKQSKLELRRFSAEESIRLAEEKIKNVMNSDTDSRLVKASINSIGGLN
ncbi:MAG: ATP synthase F0 subunit B [Pyrinomonadaceae bacterium]